MSLYFVSAAVMLDVYTDRDPVIFQGVVEAVDNKGAVRSFKESLGNTHNIHFDQFLPSWKVQAMEITPEIFANTSAEFGRLLKLYTDKCSSAYRNEEDEDLYDL